MLCSGTDKRPFDRARASGALKSRAGDNPVAPHAALVGMAPLGRLHQPPFLDGAQRAPKAISASQIVEGEYAGYS